MMEEEEASFQRDAMTNPQPLRSPSPPEGLNPFVHNLELNIRDKIKVAVFTVILPLRMLVVFALLVVAWMIGTIGLLGHNDSDMKSKPMTGWRRDLKPIICLVLRAMFVAAGFHWITVKGKQATAQEAPVLALSPHSSLFDALPIIFMGAPSIVAKAEAEQTPFFGKLINYTQPVYVCREDPNSRQNTIKEIQRRADSGGEWSQVIIFPEGTCTNRSCLITFKPVTSVRHQDCNRYIRFAVGHPRCHYDYNIWFGHIGAFYPGVAVQPVCIKYPNRLDTITWTWEGPRAWKLLWLTLCQFHNYCEIEYLPVYRPNAEEIKNPRLFANNVRTKMAEALGVPVADYTYDDCRLMSKAAKKNLPYERGLVEVQKLRAKLGEHVDYDLTRLDERDVELELARYAEIVRGKDGLLTLEDFSAYLNLPVTEPTLKELFSLYDLNGSGKIDFRQYLIGVSVISKPLNTEEAIQLAFKLFDRNGKGSITKDDLTELLKTNLNMMPHETERIFNQVDVQGKGYITYDEFKSCAQRKPEYAKIFQTHRCRWQQAKEGKRRAALASENGDKQLIRVENLPRGKAKNE